MQTKIGGSSEARLGIGSGSECRSPEQWAGSSEGGIEHFFGEGAAFVLLRCFGVTGWECGSLSESTSEKEISLSRSEMRTRFAGGAGSAEGRDRQAPAWSGRGRFQLVLLRVFCFDARRFTVRARVSLAFGPEARRHIRVGSHSLAHSS